MEPFPVLMDSFGGKNGGNSLGLGAETGDRIGRSLVRRILAHF